MKNQITYQLQDGEPISFRPITGNDEDMLRAGFEHLSAQSRFKRFLSPKNSLSDKQVRYLTDVDQQNHVAWAALNKAETEGLGVGRFVRLIENPSTAEYAITVIDDYHNRGLGTVLFTLVYLLANKTGVKHLKGYLLQQNRHFVDRLKGLNAIISNEDGVFSVRIPVTDDFSALPKNFYANRFIQRYHKLETLLEFED